MSLFDELKTLTFAMSDGHSEAVRFCEKEERMFVLLSDVWRLCEMTGDKAAVVSIYVKAKGREAAQHFIFRGQPPGEALVSKDVAERMVSDWTKDAEDSIFLVHPVAEMFAEARRAMHGLQIIRAIFERVSGESPPSQFDVVALRLEVDLASRSLLSNWGRPGSGFPALGGGQTSFLRSLTMQAGEIRRAKRVHHDALRFFEMAQDRVYDRIQPRTSSLHLR